MTVLNFPSTAGKPTDGSFQYIANGVVYSWDGEKWVSNTQANGGGGGRAEPVHFDGPDAPDFDSLIAGDQWYNTNDGRLYTYTLNDNNVLVWVDASPDSQVPQFWERNGTRLEPANAGDDVGSPGGLSATGNSWRISDVGQIDSWGNVGYGLTIADTSSGTAQETIVLNRDGSATFNTGNISFDDGASGGGAGITVTNTAGGDYAYRILSGGGIATAVISSNGSATFGDVGANSGGVGPLGGLTNVRSTAGFNVTQVSNQQCSYTHDRIIFNAGNYYVVNESTVGVKLINGQTSWDTQSDLRLKTGVAEIADGLEKVSRIRGVTGRFKTDDPDVSRSMLIAQEVKDVLPQAVSEDTDGMFSIRYTEVIPLLVSALHDAKDRIEDLEAKVQQLEGGTN